MVIFIMMLASSALMYYYFQRAKALERDLYAIQRGELDPSEAGRSFLGQLRNYSHNSQHPASSAVVNDSDSDESPTPAVPSPPASAPPAESDLPPAAIAVEEDNGLHLDTLEDSPTGQNDFIESEVSDEAETLPSNDEDPRILDEDSQSEASQQPDESQPSGESLYDMEAPTVRVRAPRRN